MKKFIQYFGNKITGILSGLDRVRFRGTLMGLIKSGGVISCMQVFKKELKDFGRWADEKTRQIREEAVAVAIKCGRPVIHVPSKARPKEEIVKEIVQRDGIKEGLICVLTAMELGFTYELLSNRKENKKPLLVRRQRLCQHIYHYYLHREFGLLHTRLQTWLPFSMHLCLNGREWLKCQMDKQGLKYCKQDNAFSWVKDVSRAQELLEAQLQTSWSNMLNEIAFVSNPGLLSAFKEYPMQYYWSVESSEWASDVMFSDPRELSRLSERLIMQGIKVMDSEKVMRFLGRKAVIDGRFKGKTKSNYNKLPEGVCIKHHHNKNSLKLYTKASNFVLRAETT